MTYHRLTEDYRYMLMDWLKAQGYDGLPGPRNWLRAMVDQWAQASNLPDCEPTEQIPYGYEDYEQMAYQAMLDDIDAETEHQFSAALVRSFGAVPDSLRESKQSLDTNSQTDVGSTS